MNVPADLLARLLSEQGAWALLVFVLLIRDHQKEAATRELLNRNTQILTEITTVLAERLPRLIGRRES
jgi:hypothetical protein